MLFNPNYTRAAKQPASIIEIISTNEVRNVSLTPKKVLSAFSHSVKKMQRIMGPCAHAGTPWDYVIYNF